LVIVCLLLWGDTAPLEIRMWGSSLLFGLTCYLSAAEHEFQRHLTRAFVVSAIALCVMALTQHYFAFPNYQGYQEPRDILLLLLTGNAQPVRLANLTFDHFNSAGAYLTLVVGVLFGAWLGTARSATIGIATLLGLVALYLTYSRGAALATTASLVAAGYAVLRPSWRFGLVVGVVAVVFVAAIVLTPLLVTSEYSTTLTFGSRALIWYAYVQAWLTSPVFGLGPGNGYATAQFLSPFGDEYAAHSNYLYLAADYGAVGVLLIVVGFAAVIARALRVAPARRRTQPLLLGAIAVVTALAVHSVVDHTLVVFSYRVALFGVIAASLRMVTPEAGPLAVVETPPAEEA
jgi:O-antigen ligase